MSSTRTIGAEDAIESLRYGIPPPGRTIEFTVGRSEERIALIDTLDRPWAQTSHCWLVKANYGTGKTHLLRLIRELALERDYAVALIGADAQGGVRFNRMEMVLSAIVRNIEIPNGGQPGLRSLFDRFMGLPFDHPGKLQLRGRNWRWAHQLESPGLWIALRAWCQTDRVGDVRATIENWLSFTYDHGSAHAELYRTLVKVHGSQIFETRTSSEMKRAHVFDLRYNNHEQTWAALSDLDTIAKACGLAGLVLLVDEFEDVIHNFRNSLYEQQALNNLLRFFNRFPGVAYFAVTPDFRSAANWCWDDGGTSRRFDELASIPLPSVDHDQALELLKRIVGLYSEAYECDASGGASESDLIEIIVRAQTDGGAAWLRMAITDLIAHLDDTFG